MTEQPTIIIKNSVYKPNVLSLLNTVSILAFSIRLSSIGPIEKNGFRSCASSKRNLYIASSNNNKLREPHDVLRQLKSRQLLHNCTKNHV